MTGRPPIRVMVVDDSPSIRGLVTKMIADEPDMAVVATAADGEAALRKLASTDVDVMLLDLEMPKLDGLGTLERLTGTAKAPRVVVLSTLTERGTAATLRALAAGAVAHVPKPIGGGGHAASLELIRSTLVQTVRSLDLGDGPVVSQPPVVPASDTRGFDAVAVASSTGGPAALEVILRTWSEPLRVPVFVAQHMPPVFTATLAERLDRKVASPVVEAEHGRACAPGTVYIAAGGFHLGVRGGRGGPPRISLSDAAPINSCRPSADHLFDSVERTFAGRVLYVVLTGMGADGADAAARRDRRRSILLAQDAETSVVYGMPRAAAERAEADEVVPLDQLGPRISELTRRRTRLEVGR